MLTPSNQRCGLFTTEIVYQAGIGKNFTFKL